MGGIMWMARKSPKSCVFVLIFQNFPGSQRECVKFLLSGVCGGMASQCNVRRINLRIFLPKFHWVLLGCGEEISPWKLWLQLYDFAREYANLKCTCISFSWNFWKWEHRVIKTMDRGLWGWLGGGKYAQIQVKKFSSKRYMSHRRVTEGVAVVLDP